MTNTSKHEHPLSKAFLPPVMGPEHASSVIDRALDFRGKASDSVRSRLNSAIKDSVSIQGFRDASIAPRQQLRDPILAAIVMSEKQRLAVEVLRTWAESNDSLRTLVTDHLRSMGNSAEGPDLQEGIFCSTWPRHEWTTESELIANKASNGRFDGDDVGLMLCYVSGRVPVEAQVEMESPIFQEWLDELSELPPEAPEWDYADEFATSVAGLAFAKIAERRTVQIEAIASSITEIVQEFDDELQYLEIDISSWSADDVVRSHLIETALGQLTGLKSALAEYRPIRTQAPSRSEESLRAPERERCEELILDIAATWDETMNVLEEQDNDPVPQASQHRTAEGDSDALSTSEEPSVDNPSADETDTVQAVFRAIQDANPISSELDRLQQDNESLSSENDQLKQGSEHLRADKTQLGDQISSLKRELSQSREMQEYWRRTYVSTSAGQVRIDQDQPVIVSSIRDALELAEQSFPDRLRISLNSKSNRNTPFQKPEEVFDALAWLATEYHRRRSNPGTAPNFDKLIKEACPGWSYKSKQTGVTKEQFTEWYTTAVDGKSYELDAHIGKGTSFDPQQTIRIAFDWDDELKQVIVGYLGRHQRNRRS